MTDLLKELLRQFGMVYITISQLSARPGSEFQSLKEYYDSLGPPEQDEPVVIVKISEDGKGHITRRPPNVARFGQEYERADATLWEMPQDEFYFFQAFRPAMFDLEKDLPKFVRQMAYVYCYELFESYVSDILRHSLVQRAADDLEKRLGRIMRQPVSVILEHLRAEFRLSGFSSVDSKVTEISLVRNCLVHNKGLADPKLASACPYQLGDPIEITVDKLIRTIDVLKKAAIAIDGQV